MAINHYLVARNVGHAMQLAKKLDWRLVPTDGTPLFHLFMMDNGQYVQFLTREAVSNKAAPGVFFYCEPGVLIAEQVPGAFIMEIKHDTSSAG